MFLVLRGTTFICTLMITELFYSQILKMNRGSYALSNSPFLDTDELKIALLARIGSGAFEKRAPGNIIMDSA